MSETVDAINRHTMKGVDPQGETRPVAVDTQGAPFVTGYIQPVGPVPITGIGTGAAYASGDAFGGKITITVPVRGIISNLWFFDYDDEGLAKELVLFSSDFTATADNSAFALLDADLKNCIGVINVDLFYNFTNNQIGNANPALAYFAPEGRLYGQWVTRGADNIATGALPDFLLAVAE